MELAVMTASAHFNIPPSTLDTIQDHGKNQGIPTLQISNQFCIYTHHGMFQEQCNIEMTCCL